MNTRRPHLRADCSGINGHVCCFAAKKVQRERERIKLGNEPAHRGRLKGEASEMAIAVLDGRPQSGAGCSLDVGTQYTGHSVACNLMLTDLT